jgi:signal transduction histidine kinase
VELEVTDDGRGLPAGTRLSELERVGHMGLAGMRERIMLLGGTVQVGAAPTGGVRVVARVPATDEA